jgi:hypothetical protein
MSIIARQELIDNKWFIWLKYDGLNCLMFEVDHELNETEAKAKLAEWQGSQVEPESEEDGTTEQD